MLHIDCDLAGRTCELPCGCTCDGPPPPARPLNLVHTSGSAQPLGTPDPARRFRVITRRDELAYTPPAGYATPDDDTDPHAPLTDDEHEQLATLQPPPHAHTQPPEAEPPLTIGRPATARQWCWFALDVLAALTIPQWVVIAAVSGAAAALLHRWGWI